jgi:hypothetical protein
MNTNPAPRSRPTPRSTPHGPADAATSLRSSLAAHAAVTPASAEQLDTMRRAAWHRQGVVMLRPEELEAHHPWLAQAARSWALEHFGPRQSRK